MKGRPGLLTRFRASMSAAADAWTTPLSAPYNAATTRGRFSRWRPGSSGPNAVVSASAPELVRRSRDMRRNNPIAKRAQDLLVTHIVGAGIKPRSLCSNNTTQAALMQLWDDWTKVSDADGQLDFYGQQAQATLGMVVGGETFARLRARRVEDGLPVPLQVQLIPAEQVPLDYSQANGTNPVFQGIERDAIANRVAYWMYPQHPGDPVPGQTQSLTPGRIDAADIAHLFNATDDIGQIRGLPWLAAAMTTLHQVNDYLDAELVRKQAAAMMVGFLLRGVGDDDVTPEQLGKLGQVTPGASDIPDVAMEPGAFNILNPGQTVKFNEPADVGASFDPFLRVNYRAVAAAAGVLYAELTGDWTGMNDRTYRAVFNTFKRQATAWQYNLVCAQFNLPVWSRFVDYAVASGAIRVPRGMSDADLRRVSWAPDRWAYVNPLQDVQTDGLEMALGLTSRAAKVAERGEDVEVIDAQVAQDRAREKKAGLTYGTGKAGDQPSPGAEPPKPPEPDEPMEPEV